MSMYVRNSIVKKLITKSHASTDGSEFQTIKIADADKTAKQVW
jgi:hypothetical protein